MAYVIEYVRLDDLILASGLKIYSQLSNPLVALYRVSYMLLCSRQAGRVLLVWCRREPKNLQSSNHQENTLGC